MWGAVVFAAISLVVLLADLVAEVVHAALGPNSARDLRFARERLHCAVELPRQTYRGSFAR